MAEPLNISDSERESFTKTITGAFEIFDNAGNKTCDVREVGTIVRSLGIYPSEEQLSSMMKEMEEDEPTGYVTFDKLCDVCLKYMAKKLIPRDNEEKIYRAFQALDVDKKGYLTEDELRSYMMKEGEAFSNEEMEEMLAACLDPLDKRIHYDGMFQ